MQRKYRQKKYHCGEYLEVVIYPVYAKAKGRGKRCKPTSEIQKRLNQRHAEGKLRPPSRDTRPRVSAVNTDAAKADTAPRCPYKLQSAVFCDTISPGKRGSRMTKILFVCHGRISPNSEKPLCL